MHRPGSFQLLRASSPRLFGSLYPPRRVRCFAQHPPLQKHLDRQDDCGEPPAVSMYDRGRRPDQDALKQLLAKGVRPYFYYIDIHGRVFLQDTTPKDLTSCYKDPRFLDFFISRIKPNSTGLFPEYSWISPCGKELNFVEAADTPITFHGLQDGHLLWAGTQRTPFFPNQLCVSASTGRIYHPLPRPLQAPLEASMGPGKQHQGCNFGLLKSSMVLSELAAGLEHDSVLWQGSRFPLTVLP
ncbi:hypothetical protein BGX34_000421 [Mortierella sp. NVP85]|nr:hypothetical protein BGX34_000421 [Mortierella sp. NVP85]